MSSKEKGVNVQVLLRCRPKNEEETKSGAPQVVNCYESRKEVVVYQNIAGKTTDRTFTFDKVFGPNSKQSDLYNEAVVPIVNEVLEGFNCTIFAYGQTGTGKTYTMEGQSKKTSDGNMSPDAGVIPRAIQQIFDTLESQLTEYHVKVTFLELYNEELTDLLAPDEVLKPGEDKNTKPLQLMEDGKGSVLVRGLEEVLVRTAPDIYTLLERGSAKRRTAETLLNKQSSRSHSIFSVSIYIKEATPEGEELIKCGKLNLVDLAGSENISRSGAREGRAREAGEINKSLLTLGRCINALVEHSGHVPFRDSKLTRLLRDSLGGRTKTCVIATVSPAVLSMEETLSTLDYAQRAKSIKNKPEINQKTTKSLLLSNLASEIDRLKSELYAARERSGVFMPKEIYNQEQEEKRVLSEKLEATELEFEAKTQAFSELEEKYEDEKNKHAQLQNNHLKLEMELMETKEELEKTKQKLKESEYIIKEKEFIISKYQKSEQSLKLEAKKLRNELQHTSNDVEKLYSKIDRKNKVEKNNEEASVKLREIAYDQIEIVKHHMFSSLFFQRQLNVQMKSMINDNDARKEKEFDKTHSQIKNMKKTIEKDINSIVDKVLIHSKGNDLCLEEINSKSGNFFSNLKQEIIESVTDAEKTFEFLKQIQNNQKEEIENYVKIQNQMGEENISKFYHLFQMLDEENEKMKKELIERKEKYENAHAASIALLNNLSSSQAKKEEEEEKEVLMQIASILSSSRCRISKDMNDQLMEIRNDLNSNSENMNANFDTMHTYCKESVQTQLHNINEHYASASQSTIETMSEMKGKMNGYIDENMIKIDHSSSHWKNFDQKMNDNGKQFINDIKKCLLEGEDAENEFVGHVQQWKKSSSSNVNDVQSILQNLITESHQLWKEDTNEMKKKIEMSENEVEQGIKTHENNTNNLQKQFQKYLDDELKLDIPTGSTPLPRKIPISSMEDIERECVENEERLVIEFKLKFDKENEENVKEDNNECSMIENNGCSNKSCIVASIPPLQISKKENFRSCIPSPKFV